MKKVVILGSTGSIGRQTLNVIRRYPDKFEVLGLVAHSNYELLIQQAEEFKPKYVGLVSSEAFSRLVLSYRCVMECGKSILSDFAAIPECDIVVCAVVGMSGFDGVLSAIKNKKQVALANKEVLVSGGEFVMQTAKKYGVNILPVDSEHSAVWQCIDSRPKETIKQIILTASGGPFRNAKSIEELKTVSVSQAVAHPNWSMGRKISVDSATMMNKGLEIIEARWLFDSTEIDYVIHPQSIIHSMIKLIDGSIIAQLSNPNMELPIQLALGYPDRLPCQDFDFPFDKDLTFKSPNEQIFPLPKLAKETLKIGGAAPCILNAANEVAVDLFLNEKIAFTDIYTVVNNAVDRIYFKKFSCYDDIISAHEETMARVKAEYKTYLEA